MPAVAGKFYPSDPAALTKVLGSYLEPETPEKLHEAKACVTPHAGYMYSGHVAGAVYRRLPARRRYLILGPNHFGNGEPLALMSRGYWQTPLGFAAIDEEFAGIIRDRCSTLVEDEEAHAGEHSLEVQVPFLQRSAQEFAFVPIAIGAVGYEDLITLGQGIAGAIRDSNQPVFVIASSDMNHYEPDSVTRDKDRDAINRILALDSAGLLETLDRRKITMCGYGPVVVMLSAIESLGAHHAILEKYATSADAGGDPRSVVGYAGIILH